MKPESSHSQPPIPEAVARKLQRVRARHRWVTAGTGVLWALTVLLGLLLAALLLDLVVGWFDPRVRTTITFLVLGSAVTVLILRCIVPLARRRTLADTALEVDQLRPEFEERLSTVTELAQSQDPPTVRGSAVLIEQVSREAATAGDRLNPEALVPAGSMARSAGWLGLAAAALGLFLVLNLSSARVLLERFWIPIGNASLTRVTASPTEGWIPKGEPVTVTATLEGRLPGNLPRLSVRDDAGDLRTVNMQPRRDESGKFLHTLDAVTGSIRYRIRAGDGQTEWRRLEAVDRPRITGVRVKITPPAYTHLEETLDDALPSSLRVVEGSLVELRFRSDQDVERMVLDLGNGASLPLTAEGEGWFAFRDRPTNSFQFGALAINRYQLENRVKPTSRVSVYADQAPLVTILEPSDDLAVAPGDKVDITFEASDDFGLAGAELIVTTQRADGRTNSVSVPVELGPEEGAKQVRRTVSVDPGALGLKHGDELSYVVQVTDTRELVAAAGASGRESLSAAGAEPDADEALATDSGPDSSEAAGTGQIERPDPSQDETDGQEAGATSEAMANAADRKNLPSEGTEPGDTPPPNEMSRRALDAGQSAACQPRSIRVDEWAGTFDGEKREKLEIAIDPVLKRLEALLAEAQERAAALQSNAVAGGVWGIVDGRHLAEARVRVSDSLKEITGLTARTSGTPYAFIGLQLQNIGAAHITPAEVGLGEVSLETALAAQGERLDRVAFHLGRARELLADLTRTYETVKRDQRIADAMQRLNKMHQIFLEDTQALLGGAGGPINSYDRKIAEVDDEYAQRLRELLEEKRQILAELAKLLEQDPRLLRRYLAMLEQHGTSYRDQMTLLARRQQDLQGHLTRWNAGGPGEVAAAAGQFRDSLVSQRQDAARKSAELRDHLETWLPLDIKPETPAVQSAIGRADRLARASAMAAAAGDGEVRADAGRRALDELRGLHESLPELSRLLTLDEGRLAAYIANRMAEVETLMTRQSGLLKIDEALDRADLAGAAEVVEHAIAQDTVTLGEKLELVEDQVSSLSTEIAEKAAALNRAVKDELVAPELVAVERFAARDLPGAGGVVDGLVPAFERAEQTFDELMQLIIAKLDEAPPPSEPGANQDLDSLLTMLEDEMKAAEGLGIPCRPINVALLRDWMRPGQGQGMGQGVGQGRGQGQAQARAAQGQAQRAKGESERLEKRARGSSQRALAAARERGEEPRGGESSNPRGEAWNKLVSQLDKDLLQGRDNVPPEQYREAIANYFRILSESDADR